MSNNIAKAYIEPNQTSMMELFHEALTDCSSKKAPSKIFDWVQDTPQL